MGYIYIFGTILFTVYGQLILKWRINKLSWFMPEGGLQVKIAAYLHLFFDPFILSGLFAAFVASVFWTLAMSKFELTFAYPFMSLSPSIVFLLGIFLLGETFTIGKVLGLVFIIIGIFITVKF